jgi:hypothetical protein
LKDFPILFPAGFLKVFSKDFASDSERSLGSLGGLEGFFSSVFSVFGAREGEGLELPVLEVLGL